MLGHVGGHLNPYGDRGVSTDLLPGASRASLTHGKQKQSLGLRTGSGSSAWSLVFPPVLPQWKTVALVCCPGCIFFPPKPRSFCAVSVADK